MEPLEEAIERARKARKARKVHQEREDKIEHAVALGIATPDADILGKTSTEATEQLRNEPPTASQTDAQDLPTPAQVRYSATRQILTGDEGLSRNRVVAGQVHDERASVYRQLRSQVLAAMKRNNWRTLAITSAHQNAGKTLTAVNLAISISQEVNQTVMLVDLDLRSPDVHNTLNISIEKGIVDHLNHGEPIENILLNPGFPRLVILPGMPQGQLSSEILSSPEMKTFLDDVVNRYSDRIIIFDLPPLLSNDDALVFVPRTDCCLLVVEDNVTRPEDIIRSVQLLEHSQLIGTVLNKAT
jgi:protein-tyrosine kinase